MYTVPQEFNFARYNMKCSGENLLLREKFHVVSCFPQHFMLYRGNVDCFSDSVTIRDFISVVIFKITKHQHSIGTRNRNAGAQGNAKKSRTGTRERGTRRKNRGTRERKGPQEHTPISAKHPFSVPGIGGFRFYAPNAQKGIQK